MADAGDDGDGRGGHFGGGSLHGDDFNCILVGAHTACDKRSVGLSVPPPLANNQK